MSFPWFLSLMVGFLSLSQELLWIRLIGFTLGGVPLAFGFVLTCYLIGIAVGAAVGKRACERSSDLYRVAAITLVAAALTDALPPYLTPLLIGHFKHSQFWITPAIVLTAAIKSVLFPIAHHLGSKQTGPRVGSSVSNIYFGNIIGSTLGPIVTGFYLLDVLSVDDCFRLVACLSIVMAALCALRSRGHRILLATVGIGTCAGTVALWLPASHFVVMSGDLAAARPSEPPVSGQIGNVIENKHGVIHTVSIQGRDDDVVYGGNMYDGRINTDVKNDTNGLSRLYVLAALHPRPQRVLVIGVSGGAWTQVLAGFAGTVKIDAVEINKGYVNLIRRYPAVSPLLDDPKVQIHIDDGRRWLRRHPELRFDLIVMNTTFHWRAYATNLLSREFLTEAATHLSPGGVISFNTTSSLDAYMTANAVFPFVYRYMNFAYAANTELRIDPELAKQRLEEARISGRPVFSREDFASGAVGDRIARLSLEPATALLQRYKAPTGIITDANMLSEYRHGNRPGWPFRALLPPEEDVAFLGVDERLSHP